MTVPDALRSLNALERSVTDMSGWQDADHNLLKRHRKCLEALADHAQYFNLKAEEEEET